MYFGEKLKLIIEADGGSRGNPGPAAYGCLVKNAKTNEILFKEGKTLGITTNNVAEYSGLVAGLTAAHRIDANAEIEVRMDSKLVVEQMSGNWKIKLLIPATAPKDPYLGPNVAINNGIPNTTVETQQVTIQ